MILHFELSNEWTCYVGWNVLDEATQMQNSISCNIRIFIQHSSNIRTKMLDEMLDAFPPVFNVKLLQ